MRFPVSYNGKREECGDIHRGFSPSARGPRQPFPVPNARLAHMLSGVHARRGKAFITQVIEPDDDDADHACRQQRVLSGNSLLAFSPNMVLRGSYRAPPFEDASQQ